MNDYLLIKQLGAETLDYGVLSEALVRAGYVAPNKKIHDLMKAGVLMGIKRGFYAVSPDYTHRTLCRESIANLIYGPSCVSLESALSYHGLIPEKVSEITSVTPKRDQVFDTSLGRFSYHHLPIKKYKEGIDHIWIDVQHPVLMASPEKAVCDYMVFHEVVVKSHQDAGAFLADDLRVSDENWKRLNLISLHQLNRVYKNPNIEQVILFLEKVVL